MSTYRQMPILRLLVLSRVDSVTLFAGDAERPKKPRVTYHSHLNQVMQFVHVDGVRILNLASHGATCRHALRCTEHLARYGVPPTTTPDIEAKSFCKTLAEGAEGRRADASVVAGAEADARNPALTQGAVAEGTEGGRADASVAAGAQADARNPALTPYLFRRTNQRCRAVDPPQASRFGRDLVRSLDRHTVLLQRDVALDTLFN